MLTYKEYTSAVRITGTAQSISTCKRECVTEESSAIETNVMVFIPLCFVFMNGGIFTLTTSMILALSSAISFTQLVAVDIQLSAKGGYGEHYLDETH